MGRIARFCLLGVIAAVMAWPAIAQYETIQIKTPFKASRLAGVVVDATGSVVSGVVIEDRDAASHNVMASATTDANGQFSFPASGPISENGTVHHLHFQSNGFDPMQITVRLSRRARGSIRVVLVVAS